jgi:hypothetical protein
LAQSQKIGVEAARHEPSSLAGAPASSGSRRRLDAIYFLLYGVTEPEEVRYIYSTFPIVERAETAAHGRYLSRDYCLMYMNALKAGDPDAIVSLD